MNVLKKIKKVAAFGVAAGMLTTTVAAADLGDFPAPYVNDNGVFSGKIVIGENAATADVIGAVDIAAALQAAAGTPVNVAGGVSVTGGQLEDVELGATLASAFGTTLDDVDLPGSLREFTISIDNDEVDDNYDAHEEIRFASGTTFGPHTALTFDAEATVSVSVSDMEDFEDNVFIPVDSGDMKYCLVFDEALETDGFIANATSDDPIYLDFLGRELEIIDADADSMTVKIGETFLLDAGDSVVVDGRTVTLVRTTDNSAVIEVNGETVVIDEGKDDDVGGITIQVDNVYNDDGVEYDSAEILVGDETEEDYDNGDAFIGEDEDDPMWEWELANLDGTDPTICVSWALDVESPDENNNPEVERPIYEGESYVFPFDYASVMFEGMTVEETQRYTVSTDSETLYNDSSTERYSGNKDVIVLVANGLDNQGFLVNGSKSEAVYLYDAGTEIEVFRKDRDGSKALYSHSVGDTETLFSIDYKKTSADATLGNWVAGGNNSGNISIEFASDDILRFEINSGGSGFTFLGSAVEDDEPENDLVWVYDGTNYIDLRNIEANVKTKTGVIIEDPSSAVESDEFVFHVSADATDYKANVIVSGKGTSTARTAGSTAVKVNPIAVGMAVSDANAMGMLGRENLIVVGGPCANDVAASLLDSGADCTEGFEDGFGRIQWFDSQKALLVAGYTAADTTRAARVLADYDANSDDFMGKTEVRVITSTGSITGVE